jgi:hypothetical protein
MKGLIPLINEFQAPNFSYPFSTTSIGHLTQVKLHKQNTITANSRRRESILRKIIITRINYRKRRVAKRCWDCHKTTDHHTAF